MRLAEPRPALEGRAESRPAESRPARRGLGRVASALTATVLAALLVAGCSNEGSSRGPDWVPQPDFQANAEPEPQLPGGGLALPEPTTPSSGGSQPTSPASPGPSGSANASADGAVLATKLNQPTGLVVLPDGSALVGERTTGRILRVQPRAGQPVTLVQTLPGVDGSGDGGLLDLALSPTFDEDGLVYAYLSTATDNRVVHFPVGGTPSPVLVGIPKGRTDNSGRIAFDATGALLIGTGDAGNSALAASSTSLAGKILRTTDIGGPAEGNPTPGSLILASGFRTVDGLCVDPLSGVRIALSQASPDEVNLIKPGAGYGWPTAKSTSIRPIATLPATSRGAGGCALNGGELFIATSTGKAVAAASVSSTGAVSAFTASLQGKYGRLRTAVLGSDGALWLTTSNRDGHGQPTPEDDRVIRIPSPEVSASSQL
jgi:glucose/arabinose dehydrogenase